MNVRTFQASTLPDALRLVRQELGPDASVLTTEMKAVGWLGRFTGRHVVEVTAFTHVVAQATVPAEAPVQQAPLATATIANPQPPTLVPADDSSFGSQDGSLHGTHEGTPDGTQLNTFRDSSSNMQLHAPPAIDYRDRLRQFAVVEQSDSVLESMVQQHQQPKSDALPSSLFSLFTDLLAADVDDQFARDLLETVQRNSTPAELADTDLVREKAAAILASRIRTAPAIAPRGVGRNVVALIGPTGVGKTTTIAKLAANLRLRDKHRVGMITVDTYRIAAVDQLRAYANIIDLPMEVVTTPKEMRDAVSKLSGMDIVLIDTAGRSPQDEIQIQQLKAMLSEAQADEVHLVLSSVSSSRHLARLVEHFQVVNPTSLLLTKLDEALELGHLLPAMCDGGLPVSYTTHGQNVPDDIQPADPGRIVERVFTVK